MDAVVFLVVHRRPLSRSSLRHRVGEGRAATGTPLVMEHSHHDHGTIRGDERVDTAPPSAADDEAGGE